MSNLIITVIAIALTAVAALMGAYFGGSAFMEGQAKAGAIQFENQAKQISAAINVYMATTGQDFASSLSTYPNAPGSYLLVSNQALWDLLVPSYLSQAIVKPKQISVSRNWSFSSAGSQVSLTPSSYGAAKGYYLNLTLEGVQPTMQIEVCNQIAKMARGPNAVPLGGHGGNPVAGYAGMNNQMDCTWNDYNTCNNLECCKSNACTLILTYKVY